MSYARGELVILPILPRGVDDVSELRTEISTRDSQRTRRHISTSLMRFLFSPRHDPPVKLVVTSVGRVSMRKRGSGQARRSVAASSL